MGRWQRFVDGWHRYWFAEGGRYTVAILRVAIAASVLLSLWRLWGHRPLAAPAEIYRPVGVWMALGDAPPAEILVEVLWWAAWGGTAAMLVGLCSRAATAVSAVAAISLAALSFSGRLTWSHQYNVVFVAQLALLGARSGDALSLDALIRRLRGRPARDVPRGYEWSVRLVLLGVSLMFIGAAIIKLGSSQFTLRWALSDSLRHHLLVHYDMSGIPRPELVDWLLAEPWRYRTAALGNLVSQLAPLVAIFYAGRPLLRAAGGMFFVLEVLGLGFVVSLWNLHWLPLAVVYVDWDRLFARLRGAPGPAAVPDPAALPPRRVRLFVIAFVLYTLVASIPGLDQKLNTYPFSSFPMFSKVRAKAPYDEHFAYAVPGDHYEAIADRPIDPLIQRWLDYQNRNLHTVRDPDKLRTRLGAVLARAQARFPDAGIRGLRHHLALFIAPPHPAPARFERHLLAITGELLPDGTYRSLLGRLTRSGVELRPEGLDASAARLVYFADDEPAPRELRGARAGDSVTVSLPHDPVYVAAELDGKRWLVAWRRNPRRE